jgi:hypothetical protein
VIYLVVRLTWVPGKAADGSDYERTVLRFWVEHGGEIVAAFKPLAQADGLPPADEVQILRIPTQAQLDAYLSDPRRLALSPKRAASIAVTDITISEKMVSYA